MRLTLSRIFFPRAHLASSVFAYVYSQFKIRSIKRGIASSLASSTSFRLEGADDLARRLKAIDDDVRKNIGRAAVRNAAKVVRVEVENSAPPRTTAPIHIADSVKVQVASKEETSHSWMYYVRISRKAFYWYFYEFGTSRQPPRPFFRPAFERSHREALNEMIRTLRRRLIR